MKKKQTEHNKKGLLPIEKEVLARRQKKKPRRGRPTGVKTKSWVFNQRVEMYHETLALVEMRLNTEEAYHREMCKTANENMAGKHFDNMADLHQEFGFQLGLAVAGEAFIIFLCCDPGETSLRDWIKINHMLAKGIEPRKDGKEVKLPKDVREEVMREAKAFLQTMPSDNVRQLRNSKSEHKDILSLVKAIEETEGIPFVDQVARTFGKPAEQLITLAAKGAKQGFKITIGNCKGKKHFVFNRDYKEH